ncbi:MAG: hypothetical protein ACFFFG_02660 [Candidatus Thorarchaeota archaeon]
MYVNTLLDPLLIQMAADRLDFSGDPEELKRLDAVLFSVKHKSLFVFMHTITRLNYTRKLG